MAGGAGGRAEVAFCGRRGGNLLRMAPITGRVGLAIVAPLTFAKNCLVVIEGIVASRRRPAAAEPPRLKAIGN